MIQKNGKLYDPKMENYMIPQIKVRLNLHINSTLMSHQMVFTFCAHILNSYIAWHSRKTGKSMMSYHREPQLCRDVML